MNTLYLLTVATYAMATTTSASGDTPEDCKYVTNAEPVAYTSGGGFTPNWAITEASGYTSEPFPEIGSLMANGDIMGDPYVLELINAVATGLAVCAILLLLWCCTCVICRKKRKNSLNCLPVKTKPIVGKVIIGASYALVIIVGLTAFSGQGQIGAAIPIMSEGLSDLGGALSKFVVLAGDQVTAIKGQIPHAQAMADGACDFEYIPETGADPAVVNSLNGELNTQTTAARDSAKALLDTLQSALTGVESVETQIKSADSMIGSTMDDSITLLTNYWTDYLDPVTTGFALIFVVLGAFGFLGVVVPKAFKCTLCLTWFIIWLVVIVCTVLLLVSILLGDICVPSPTKNIAKLASSATPSGVASGESSSSTTVTTTAPSSGGEADAGGDFVQFFVACEGINPLEKPAMDMLNTTTASLVTSCELLNTVSPATMTITGSGTTVTVSKKTDAECKVALKGLKDGMDKIQTSLANIVKEIRSCKFVNEPLSLFLGDGFCNGFSGGLYSMYASLFSAVIFTIAAMYVTPNAWDVIDGTRASDTSNQVSPGSGVMMAAPVAAPMNAAPQQVMMGVPVAAPMNAAPQQASRDGSSVIQIKGGGVDIETKKTGV